MAQPPPRKGAYNKFVQNLHKDQFSKLQAKNQQELDLLDDIRNFMKQRAAIEKLYADGLIKLSSVYGTKKIANIDDVKIGDDQPPSGEHNVYIIWKKMLEENEKIAKARLAAIQVFQENISTDAKTITSKKKSNSKKALDRLSAIQADVQISVSEVDRTKRVYFAEESDAIDVGKKVENAELKAKGKKRDVISIFQSRTTLKSKALKLSAKQDESDIKSTGARNDYLLAVETANAHQDRYFHHDLQMTMRDMEYGIYEKMSEYFGTIARTELLTCTALQSSYSKLQQQAETISRDYNYKCYTQTYSCLSDHVQYAFEAVEGDTIDMITPSEHDDGYSLKYEARTTAGKLNQAVKTIRAFRKRIKACEHHKAAGLQREPNDANGPNLDEKIEELIVAIRAAATDLAKAKVRLKKLREGGVEVDSYLGDINLDTVQFDIEREDRPQEPTEWGSSQVTESQPDTPAEAEQEYVYQAQDAAHAQEADWTQAGGWGQEAAEAEETANTEDWAEAGGWDQHQQWNGVTESEDTQHQQPEETTGPEIDPNADIWKALVLFTFTAQNEDELTVTENEDIKILVRECDEEGWVKACNMAGQTGYVPSNYIEVYASLPREAAAPVPGQQLPSYSSAGAGPGQVVKQVSVESNSSWGMPHLPAGMPPIPETGPPVGQTSDEASETEDDDDLPPGTAPPMGPPPTISIQDSDCEGLATGSVRRNSRPVSINFGASLESEYCRGLYDYEANGPDELSFREDDVIHIISKHPNGVDDGWWLGEHGGRRGLFPSIVAEESAADGSDWSPDVSVCGSPPACAAPPPPCFAPPPPAPTVVPPSASDSSASDMETSSPGATSNNLATTQIMITNPTPLVEKEDEMREQSQSSYYVEDSAFSMNMSNERKDKYQNSVPMEVNVVVEPVKPARPQAGPGPGVTVPELAATEIVVTAPTPRSQSPTEEDKEPLFTCTSESDSEAAPAEPVKADSGAAEWANFGSISTEGTNPSSEWANFDTTTTNGTAASTQVGDGGDWANVDKKQQPIPQVSITEPEPEPEPTQPSAPPSTVKPSVTYNVIRQVKIVETETSDFASDSDSEFINTNLQVAATDTEAGTTDAGPESSDTESEDRGRDTEDEPRTGRDSSVTESASEAEAETSRDTPSPRPGPAPHRQDIPLPPEQLETKQLKKLETMKESPA